MQEESAAVALSGPRVQLGLGVRRGSSTQGGRELKGGRDAVDGLNQTVFLSPWKIEIINIEINISC